jgi:hypothetical protein
MVQVKNFVHTIYASISDFTSIICSIILVSKDGVAETMARLRQALRPFWSKSWKFLLDRSAEDNTAKEILQLVQSVPVQKMIGAFLQHPTVFSVRKSTFHSQFSSGRKHVFRIISARLRRISNFQLENYLEYII